MKYRFSILIISSIFLIYSCCNEEEMIVDILPVLPSHFPEIPFSEDNPYSYEKWKLGKELFYSNSLSRDNSISCGSCHKPEVAFADNRITTPGIDARPGLRNVPSLANVAYHPYYTRDGEVPTLEMQILVPIQEHNEFDFNIVLIAERLQQDSVIVRMTKDAFDTNPSAFSITRALATFERTIISASSRYDNYLNGETSLSQEEDAGRKLFFSDRLGCASCHNGFDFSDYSITNNGLYQNYQDVGRFRVTNDSSDLSTFKIPSLRNVEFTAPYMHDGSISSLEAVILHYEKGVQNHVNKDLRLMDFSLTTTERDQLKSFLESLSDHHFINNPLFVE